MLGAPARRRDARREHGGEQLDRARAAPDLAEQQRLLGERASDTALCLGQPEPEPAQLGDPREQRGIGARGRDAAAAQPRDRHRVGEERARRVGDLLLRVVGEQVHREPFNAGASGACRARA